jgi:hypothetical protein
MALKVALLCFQFRTLEGILHDPFLEHDFTKYIPLPSEAIQPVVAEAVARIKRSIASSVSSWFNFGQTRITNISNFLHIATLTFNTEIEHTDGSTGQTSIAIVIKFYHLEQEDAYRVTLDIEEMHSSVISTHEECAFKGGMQNEQIEHLVELLKEEFELEGKIEYMPLIERGRLDKHCLDLGDEPVVESKDEEQTLAS